MDTNQNSVRNEIGIAADLCEDVGYSACGNLLRLIEKLLADQPFAQLNQVFADTVMSRSSWESVGRLDRRNTLRLFKVSRHCEFLEARNFHKAVVAIEAFKPRLTDCYGSFLFELLEEQVISLPQAIDSLSFAAHTNQKIESTLRTLQYATEEEVAIAVSKFHKLEFVDLTFWEIPTDFIELCPEAACRENCIIPIGEHQGDLIFASSTPDEDLKEKVSFILNRNVRFVLSTYTLIIDAINRHYQLYDETRQEYLRAVENVPIPSEFSQRPLSEVMAQNRPRIQLLNLANLFGISNDLFN